MTESDEPRGLDIADEVRTLDPDARLVLAVLAVLGRASVSEDVIASCTGLPDVRAALADLERRGLVVREDGDRHAAAPGVQGHLKRLLAAADVIDRVLRGFIRIAEDGRLTLDDLDAVLELTRIAAETGRWAELLELAEAAETSLSVTHRVEYWVEIVERRLEAARVLGDDEAARRAERELSRLEHVSARTPDPGPTSRPATTTGDRGWTVRPALAALAAVVAGTAGVAVGFALGGSSEATDTTVTTTESTTETVTETAAAETVTETSTITESQTETETETVTETVTETETVVG